MLLKVAQGNAGNLSVGETRWGHPRKTYFAMDAMLGYFRAIKVGINEAREAMLEDVKAPKDYLFAMEPKLESAKKKGGHLAGPDKRQKNSCSSKTRGRRQKEIKRTNKRKLRVHTKLLRLRHP